MSGHGIGRARSSLSCVSVFEGRNFPTVSSSEEKEVPACRRQRRGLRHGHQVGALESPCSHRGGRRTRTRTAVARTGILTAQVTTTPPLPSRIPRAPTHIKNLLPNGAGTMSAHPDVLQSRPMDTYDNEGANGHIHVKTAIFRFPTYSYKLRLRISYILSEYS